MTEVATGNKYAGTWRNNIKHGTGKFTNFALQTVTPEEWRDGKKWTWAPTINKAH